MTNTSISFRIYTTKQLFTVDANGNHFDRASILASGPGQNPCQTPSATLGAFDMASCGYPAGAYGGRWADSVMVDQAVAVVELNSRRQRLLQCDLLLLSDQTPAVGLGLAFPSTDSIGSGIADFFTLAVSNLTTAGVPAKLAAQYGARAQDSECVYVNEGGLQLGVADTSGMFAICAVLCVISVVHGIVERYQFFREKHDVLENNEIEKEDACARIMNVTEGGAPPGGADGALAVPDAEAAAEASASEAREALREVLCALAKWPSPLDSAIANVCSGCH